MVQPRPGQGNRRILSSAHPPLALSNALASIHRPIDVHENQYFRALMHDTQSSSRNRHGGSRSEVVTKTGFRYKSVAAQWFEDTPSESKLKDLNIKTTANGFKYCSVAAIWDKDEERKSDIRSRSHSRPVAVCRERSNSGTLYRSPPSTRRRSRSRKESHRRQSHEPHGGDQRSSSVSMRNVDEFNLGLKPTNRDEEERRRNERAKRFALSGGESSTAGSGGKRARRGRS